MDVVNSARVRQRLFEVERSPEDTENEGSSPGSDEPSSSSDTWVFPLVQMKPLGIHLDEQVTERLLTEAEGDSTVYLTSGYFNLTRAYMRLVLGAAADYRILMAAPEVNGFFGAKGVAGAIPDAYIHLARQFYSKVCALGQQRRVRLHEYHRNDWTFHAKGESAARRPATDPMSARNRSAKTPSRFVSVGPGWRNKLVSWLKVQLFLFFSFFSFPLHCLCRIWKCKQ